MSSPPRLRSKSGMGTDIDPIRLVLALLAFGPAVYVASRIDNDWWGVLIIASVVGGITLGWWVTRNHYLDEKDLEAYRQRTAEPR